MESVGTKKLKYEHFYLLKYTDAETHKFDSCPLSIYQQFIIRNHFFFFLSRVIWAEERFPLEKKNMMRNRPNERKEISQRLAGRRNILGHFDEHSVKL